MGHIFGAPSDQGRRPRWKNQFFALIKVHDLLVLYIHVCALFAHTCVCVCVCVCVCLCVCVSNLLVLLLIIGWLPHHCPFPEVGPYTQTFSVSSSYVLTWLVNKWHQRHGTGSLKDNPYWYFLECSHVVSIDYQKNQVHPCFNMSMPQTPQKRMTASQQLETSQPRVSRRW
jgi:hypothetical protein